MIAESPIQKERLFALFRDLVDIYSPSNKEEEIADYLYSYLLEKGLPVRKQMLEEGRYNLLVSAGNTAPTLFLGHIDTVPAYDIEQIDFAEKDGICHGLGTADMKSGCAAMIEAFLTRLEAGKQPEDVMLALVVGEEESGDGTQALLASHRFEQAVVAEPTGLRPCLHHYGYVEMAVRTFGSRRHAAMSNSETNATRALLRLLLHLETWIEQEEPTTVLNIRDLHSAESGFAVPDRCAASLDLHIPPEYRAAPFADRIRQAVEQWLDMSRASRYEVEFPTLADGYKLDEASSFVEKLRLAFAAAKHPWMPGPFTSHSDANLLNDAGCRAVILGPGELSKAHTRDESVEFEQVVGAAEIYRHLLSSGF